MTKLGRHYCVHIERESDMAQRSILLVASSYADATAKAQGQLCPDEFIRGIEQRDGAFA